MPRATIMPSRPRVYVWTGSTLADKVDLSDEVVAIQTDKTGDAPAGGWSLTLRPDVRDGAARGVGDIRRRPVRYRDLEPNQLVSIGVDSDGGIMLGLIDRVNRNFQAGGPTAGSGVTVRGRDMGKAMMVDNVIRGVVNTTDAVAYKQKLEAAFGTQHPLAQDILGVWGPESDVDGTPTFFNGTVQEVIDFILSNAPTMSHPVLAAARGGEGTLRDYITTEFSVTTWNDGRVWSEAPTTYQGSMWGYLESVLDRDFYEVRIDSIPTVTSSPIPSVVLTVRPKPFDETSLNFAPVSDSTGIGWADLRTAVEGLENHDIPIEDVVTLDIGVTDAEAAAYYLVSARNELIGNPDGLSEGLIYPLVDLYVGKRFGLRSYEASLSLLAGDVTAKAAGTLDYDVDVADDCHNFRNRLFNWYRLNPWFESGSITVRGRDVYRVGDPVRLSWLMPKMGDTRGVRFYCTGVSQRWTFGGHYLTTLTLTRGHNETLADEVRALITTDGLLQVPPNVGNYADT